MRDAVARHDQIVGRVLAEHGGYVFSTAGDSFSAAFAVPVDALRSALGVQAALGAESWPEPVVVRVRMGAHAGTADERGGDYFGPTLNRAARIMGLAGGGERLVSAAARELMRDLERDGVAFVDLGVHELRGVGAEHLFGVVGPGQPATFTLRAPVTRLPVRLPTLPTAFIGRESEVVELAGALTGGGC